VRSYNSKAKLFSCDLCGDAQGCSPCEKTSGSLRHSPVLFIFYFMLLCSLQHWLWFIFYRLYVKLTFLKQSRDCFLFIIEYCLWLFWRNFFSFNGTHCRGQGYS
jgi:hypothetical protein